MNRSPLAVVAPEPRRNSSGVLNRTRSRSRVRSNREITVQRMNLSSVLGIVVAACLISACGGGGDGASPAHPPSISLLSYNPTSFPVSSYGTAIADGSVYFTDSGGDVATVTIRVTDSQGNEVSSLSMPIYGAEGQVSGTIGGAVQVPTSVAGLYTVHLSISDSRGDMSNELDGVVTITPAGNQPAGAAPAASTQRWTPVN
jgi:hypothetical protein